MKLKALFTDIFRQIWTTRSRFFSIFAIIALGCGFFAGLKSTCPDMIDTAQQYYSDYNLMDINVKSTMGITENDIEALNNMRNVETVQPGYYADVFISDGSGASVICHVMSLNLRNCENEDYINRLRVISGKLPDRTNECVVDNKMLTSGAYRLGDKIRLTSDSETDIKDELNTTVFTIVGGVESVGYVSYERGSASIGNGVITYYMYVPEEAFSYEVYTEVFVTFNETDELYFNSEEYAAVLNDKMQLVKEIAGVREAGRYNEIYLPAMDEINSSAEKLASAEEEYAAGLNSYYSQIASAESEIASGEEDLNILKGLYERIIRLREQAGDNIEENYDSFLQFVELLEGFGGLDADELREAAETIDGLIEYLGRKISSGEEDLANGKAQLADARSSGWQTLCDAKAAIDEGKLQLDDARMQLSKLNKPSWYIFDRNNNPGYSTYAEDAERVDNIAKVFPFFFILVAALVCTTTMTRMVEEQRTAIGTLKALGYSRALILMKYLTYASLASFLGSLFGLCLGFKIFPTFIFAAYNIMYVMPPIIAPFKMDLGMASVIVSLACTNLAAFFVCYKEHFDVPSALIRPKTPKAGKRILLEKIPFIWDRIGFLKKVTIRNILRYKRRMAMTVIGIAGCTALLFTGFGLQYAITEIVDLQYGNIFNYDLMGIYNSEMNEEEFSAMDERITASAYVKDNTYLLMQSVSVSVGAGNKREVYLVVPEDTNKVRDFITFKHRTDDKAVYIENDGVVVCEKLAKLYDLSVGSVLRVSLSDTKYKEFKVTDICENYTLNYVYMSPQAYKKAYGEEVGYNAFFVNMNDAAEEDKLATEFLEDKNILALSFSSEGGGKFRDIVSSLNYIVILVIACAGALAFVVLYNLANINVTERIREIATIKVLGFYNKEVSAYINRENSIASAIGIGCGLFLGIPLEKFVIATAEVDAVMFVPTVDVYCYVYAVVLAALFTWIVNMVMHFKLKKISMVESLKSVE